MREIIENQSYSDAFHQLGDPSDLDDALVGIIWSLYQNPEEWPVIPGFQNIRRAMTDHRSGDSSIPRIRVWFQIQDPGRNVHLLFIEREPQEPED